MVVKLISYSQTKKSFKINRQEKKKLGWIHLPKERKKGGYKKNDREPLTPDQVGKTVRQETVGKKGEKF